jgi:S1-C subfamily serine protease
MPGEDADDAARRPPPHPLDRPWIHPAEVMSGPRRPLVGTPRRSSRRRDLAVAVGAGAVGAVAVVVLLAAMGAFSSERGDTTARSTAATRDTDIAARIAGRVAPSIVSIAVLTPAGLRRASGVCVGDGRVLTTASALGGSQVVDLVTSDGGHHDGRIVGEDPITDLALVRVDGAPLEPIAGSDDDVDAGRWFVAVSGGDGSGHWVSTGVVASVGGWVHTASAPAEPRAGLIATAATMPASSAGGALLDRDGRLVGIITGPAADGGGAVATPAAMARAVAAQLERDGHAGHGRLWIRAQDNPSPRGTLVTEVVEGGPAARAGVRVGDVIVRIDGRSVVDTAALVYALHLRRPGSRIVLDVRREGTRRQLTATLAGQPPDDVTSPSTAPGSLLAVAARG